jgi:heat shock protein HslJ
MRIAAVAAGVMLSACAMPKKEPPPAPFANTRWDVVMEGKLAGETPYVRFADGRMEGFLGCTHVVASYLQDSVGARSIALRRIERVSARPCEDAAKSIEARLFPMLQSVSSYSITADVMTMSGSGGTVILHAHPGDGAPAAAPPPAAARVAQASHPLSGTRWVGAVEGSTKSGNVPQLEIVTEGRLAGYTGCNLMNGTWSVQGGEARVGRIVTTKRACAGPESEIEKRLIAALAENARLVREGDRLVAISPAGERFEFTPLP